MCGVVLGVVIVGSGGVVVGILCEVIGEKGIRQDVAVCLPDRS